MMKQWMRMGPLAGILGLGLASTAGMAREPGIAPMIPPGLTLGLPIAVNPPPGLYFTSRSAYYRAGLVNNQGTSAGQKSDIFSQSFQLTWVPGWKLFGADYKMFITAPFVDVTQTRTAPFPPPLRGRSEHSGMGNPKFQFLDLSWKLADGFFFGTGVGVYFPVGQWTLNAPINLGANFWTVEPSIGFTYFKDGWNASLHVLYDTNTENRANRYYSGDQIFINATLTKNFQGFNIGPVAYYQKQVTNDRNKGGPTVFGGATALKGEQFALGGLISRQFGPVGVQIMYTHDIYARNAIKGGKAWLNLSYKLY